MNSLPEVFHKGGVCWENGEDFLQATVNYKNRRRFKRTNLKSFQTPCVPN